MGGGAECHSAAGLRAVILAKGCIVEVMMAGGPASRTVAKGFAAMSVIGK